MNNSGISLVEVMIAIGIAMILAMGSIEYTRNMAFVQRNIVTMTDIAAMNAEFNNHVNRSTSCNPLFPTLPGTPVAGFDFAAATSADGMPITVQLGDRNLSDGAMIGSHLQVTRVRFHMPNASSVLTTYDVAGTAAYTGVIRLRVQKTMITSGGTAVEEQTFGPVVLRVNAANQITHCVSLQSPEYQCISSMTSINTWSIATNTCSNTAACPAQTLSWTIGSDTCNAIFSAQLANSVSPINTDSTSPSLGSAAFTCDATGAWMGTPESGATCTSIVCPTQLLSWTVGPDTCSTIFPPQPANSISPINNDTSSPSLGSAAFTCDATGTWNVTPESGALCTALVCPAQLLSWTVGPDTCSANFPVQPANSISLITADSTLPALGSAAFTCDATGAWNVTPESGAICTTSVCPTQLLSWTVGPDTCSANFSAQPPSTVSPITADSTLPAMGSAAFACNSSGTWSALPQPGATCTASVCPAQALSWTVGANTCSANFPATPSGAVETRADLAIPNKGYAAFRCNAGVWSGTPEAGSPTPYCSPSPNEPCSASCPAGAIASLGGYWVPCAPHSVDMTTMTCEVTATEHSFPLPAEPCDLGNPTWTCPLP